MTSTSPSLSWLVVSSVLIGGFIVCAIGARLSGGRTDPSRGRHISGNRGPGFTSFVLVTLGLAAVCVMIHVNNSSTLSRQIQDEAETRTRYQELLLQRHQQAQKHGASTHSTTELTLAETSETTAGKTKTAVADHTIQALPDWTANLQTIVSSGQVDEVLLVEESTPCATKSEAIQEATAGAVKRLKDRIVADWPELDAWNIPADLITECSIRKQFVETQTHEFAGTQEPMYRVFIQFEDSAAVREPVIDLWQADVRNDRASHYALGLGAVGVGLGVISALLRGLLAFAGRPGKTVPA